MLKFDHSNLHFALDFIPRLFEVLANIKCVLLFSNAWWVHFLADFVVFIARLKKKGIETVLLSGDREEAVATIAETVGIENDFVKASLSPQQKSAFISSLKAAGHHVAMV